MKVFRLVAIQLVVLLTLTLALSAALRDTTPPQLWLEAPERVPAHEPFELFLSADEPVTYRITYGDLEMERISQDLTVSLLGVAGTDSVRVSARDGAGNETTLAHRVVAVPGFEPHLSVPAEVTSGDPLTARFAWEETGAVLQDSALKVTGAPSRVVSQEGELVAVAAAPFTQVEQIVTVEGELVDEFGRVVSRRQEVRLLPGSQGVQELNVPASTLSVITPEGRELERVTLEQAFASSNGLPLWAQSFELPIEGRSTSGFAVARRYAPGGPVSYHEGSDIAAPLGTPVLAPNEGAVLVADFFPIKGGLIVIDHGMGITSLYFHLSRIDVEPGTRVARGQAIGAVGSTGLSTGPHLHWEMRIDGEPTNPMAWAGRVWP